jgi:sugar-specific transcriptional regulator TrmB
MIEPILKEIGLKEKEISIYLSLLPLGSAPASILGKYTGITRSTAQYTCHQLEKKGIIKSVYKKNTYYYTPEPIEKLHFLLDNKIKKFEDTKEELDRMGSDLMGLMNPHTTLPKVRFYEGTDGVIELLKDELKMTKDDIGYGAHRFYKTAPKEFQDFICNEYDKKRAEMNWKSYVLWTDTPLAKERIKIDNEINRTSLLVPKEKFFFDSSFQIYQNKVAFYSYRETDLTGVLIENEHIQETMLNVFRMAWNYAKTLKINAKRKVDNL